MIVSFACGKSPSFFHVNFILNPIVFGLQTGEKFVVFCQKHLKIGLYEFLLGLFQLFHFILALLCFLMPVREVADFLFRFVVFDGF